MMQLEINLHTHKSRYQTFKRGSPKVPRCDLVCMFNTKMKVLSSGCHVWI